MQQCTNNGREEEDYSQVHMDVNDVGLEILNKEGNAFNTRIQLILFTPTAKVALFAYKKTPLHL